MVGKGGVVRAEETKLERLNEKVSVCSIGKYVATSYCSVHSWMCSLLCTFLYVK
jgi:hypothetical protein